VKREYPDRGLFIFLKIWSWVEWNCETHIGTWDNCAYSGGFDDEFKCDTLSRLL